MLLLLKSGVRRRRQQQRKSFSKTFLNCIAAESVEAVEAPPSLSIKAAYYEGHVVVACNLHMHLGAQGHSRHGCSFDPAGRRRPCTMARRTQITVKAPILF
jgi:hypothetical protein